LGGGFEDSAGEGKAELERKEKDEIAKKKARRDRMQAEYEEYLRRKKKRNDDLEKERTRLASKK
jgi:hypothetical protein